jgi:hypothetical protein
MALIYYGKLNNAELDYRRLWRGMMHAFEQGLEPMVMCHRTAVKVFAA